MFCLRMGIEFLYKQTETLWRLFRLSIDKVQKTIVQGNEIDPSIVEFIKSPPEHLLGNGVDFVNEGFPVVDGKKRTSCFRVLA